MDKCNRYVYAVKDLDTWCGHQSPHARLIARHLRATGEGLGLNAGTPVGDEACQIGGLREQLKRIDAARAVLVKWGQPAHSGEPVYAFRRSGQDDFCTCTFKRYTELSDLPEKFEMRIFYAAQPVERGPLTANEQDELYWRLHSLSKSLEGSGRIDEHDNPDAYHTILDAMNALRDKKGGQHGAE